jgi:hypothetical protein
MNNDSLLTVYGKNGLTKDGMNDGIKKGIKFIEKELETNP